MLGTCAVEAKMMQQNAEACAVGDISVAWKPWGKTGLVMERSQHKPVKPMKDCERDITQAQVI